MGARKRCVIYCRQTLDTSAAIDRAEQWALRRHYLVADVIVDGNLKQRRLAALLKGRNRSLLICPNLFHFSDPARIVHWIDAAIRLGWSLRFVEENIMLRNRDRAAKILNGIVIAQRASRSYEARRSLLLAKFVDGKRLGKPPLSEPTKAMITELLQSGMKVSDVVRRMNGKVARTSVQRLKRGLK